MEDIKKDEPILEFVGELLSIEQAMAREEHYEKVGMTCCYQMKLGSGTQVNVIDTTLYGNVARFANSSCNSNMIRKRLSQTNHLEQKRLPVHKANVLRRARY